MNTSAHRWPIRVYYEDTDAGGIVYHANYLKYFERARSEWLRELGYELDVVAREGVMFVVTRADLVFQSPARFNEALSVVSDMHEIRRASLVFRQRLMRGEQDLVKGLITVASVRPNDMRPVRLPGNLTEELKNNVG